MTKMTIQQVADKTNLSIHTLRYYERIGLIPPVNRAANGHQDVGKAINPLSVEGQLQGGSVQGVGIALWEEIMYDQEGQVNNPNLLDYRMPTTADVPIIETILIEAPGGDGPYGAKGVGEPPMIPPVAAVANAVAAAIGSRVYDLPITPERIWRTLNGQSQ